LVYCIHFGSDYFANLSFQFKIAKARKGSLASLDDLRHVAVPPDEETGCDISLLVGTTNTMFPQSHVLRLRWHNVAAAAMADGKAMALHAALTTKLLPRDGFEAM
jgi:hypothetical protein